ncbi:MAG: lysine--tRNA ligase [Gammaproteobacteria bacterium]|nr:lysine--tRNA ligase [Gammaproteobacteria bacterium]
MTQSTRPGPDRPEQSAAADLERSMRSRMDKLGCLRDRGIEAFAYRYPRTHEAREAAAAFEAAEAAETLSERGQADEVLVGGRMVAYRSHGKSAFADLEDGSGRIQVYFRRDHVGEQAFEDLELLDLGDWIGVRGRLFRTRMGQVTVQVSDWTLLTKALRPLPLGKTEVDAATGQRVTHSGFADTEARYRQRYADLAVNPEVREVFRARSQVVATARRILDGHGFLEVETPVLQPLYGGATARPFVTHHHSLDSRLYLRIADELYLKRLIVGGFERVYEEAKDFRNEGLSRFHNPEFTMLEFYQAFADYHDMMDLVEELVSEIAASVAGGHTVTYQGERISLAPPFKRIRLVEALGNALGDDPLELEDDELRARAKALHLPDIEKAGRGKLIDKLFDVLVQKDLRSPTFVLDHPRELSPLAKAKRGDARLTERFELFVLGTEIANAFSELNDPLDQRARFEDQARLAAGGDEEAHRVDEDYIRALEYGMPPTGGVGVGIDRLTMLLTDQPAIRDVILFPILRPE